ncbi:MAG TPA: AAA family ATPase [Ktedonobacterales bacterium]|nr:AAA family ATPase [Ktedonobacterales bacterium]
MSATTRQPRQTWQSANQRYLMASLDRVRVALERHAARRRDTDTLDSPPDAGPALPPSPKMIGDSPAALERLCEVFGLSAFERDTLLLCAGIELDGRFAALCASAQGDPSRPWPTFGMALAALDEAHWSALLPQAPLRRWRLVDPGQGGIITTAPLRIDESALHYLTGLESPDERLAGIIVPVDAPDEIVPSHDALAQRIAAAWQRARPATLPLMQLCGDDPAGKRSIAATACRQTGLRLLAVAADLLPTAPSDLTALLRLIERELLLRQSALLIECDDAESAEQARSAAIARACEQIRAPLLLATRERRRLPHRAAVTIEVARPTSGEQRAVWQNTLGRDATALNGHLDLLVSQFTLGATAIQSACAEAQGMRAATPETPLDLALWDACREQARPALEALAQRIEPIAGWDDLVLPDIQRQTLHEIAAHVRQRATVYESWGFATHGSRGLGISALFAGASGTGKTLAAEVLAHELRLDLYRIDLSSVVSKYIGETEKNLRRVFDAAEEGGAILLFDEADALFGKRSEVKDSHDRYANIEVSYLLQRMEAYRGLAILTTNLRSALDTAFLRRIRFIVQFPFPDATQRQEIWRRVFPAATPTDRLDTTQLARLNVAGGNIRNIALNAAFLAADAGQAVGMAHLLQASRSEYAKLEKPLTEAEIGGWL